MKGNLLWPFFLWGQRGSRNPDQFQQDGRGGNDEEQDLLYKTVFFLLMNAQTAKHLTSWWISVSTNVLGRFFTCKTTRQPQWQTNTQPRTIEGPTHPTKRYVSNLHNWCDHTSCQLLQGLFTCDPVSPIKQSPYDTCKCLQTRTANCFKEIEMVTCSVSQVQSQQLL